MSDDMLTISLVTKRTGVPRQLFVCKRLVRGKSSRISNIVGRSWIIGSRLYIILCFFLQIIHYSFQIFPWYSLFIFLVFVSVFLSQIFCNAILYIVYQKFTFQYTFNLIFSKYHSIFSINVVKIMLSFSINRPSMQLLEREGPNNSSLITLSTKK